jgi:hypothetical protein
VVRGARQVEDLVRLRPLGALCIELFDVTDRAAAHAALPEANLTVHLGETASSG